MQWFSVLEWATWLMLVLVYSKPVIWCNILETVLELEMLIPGDAMRLFPFHIPAKGSSMLNLLQVLSVNFYLVHPPRSFQMSSISLNIIHLLNEAAPRMHAHTHTLTLGSGQHGWDFPGTSDLPAGSTFQVLQSPGQLSAPHSPHSATNLERLFLRGHPRSFFLLPSYYDSDRQGADVWWPLCGVG